MLSNQTGNLRRNQIILHFEDKLQFIIILSLLLHNINLNHIIYYIYCLSILTDIISSKWETVKLVRMLIITKL